MKKNPLGNKRKRHSKPKGRQVDALSLQRVQEILGGALNSSSRNRDLLIEYLHKIQDAEGAISANHLRALAFEMRLSQAEVYETATFYHHFDVLKEGEQAPKLTVRLCDSLSCSLNGVALDKNELQKTLGDNVRVVSAPCIGMCDVAPAAIVGKKQCGNVTFEKIKKACADPSPLKYDPDIKSYMQAGGYKQYKNCIDGKISFDEVTQILLDSGLRGMGGAGFPTGKKWQLVKMEQGPRLLAINADEGEPGTFKDREIMVKQSHQFLEGILIAKWAIEAEHAYLYLRDEYPDAYYTMQRTIEQAINNKLIKEGDIILRRGAGAYICGEESAMIESLEGKRGLPRHRPPFVAQVGLFGRPTLVNNVETLAWVPEILANGAESFSKHGRNGRKGLRRFSVSGRVANPGIKCAPAGITIRELIDEYCGGMKEGHSFAAYMPGGASGGMLPAKMDDIPLDFDTLQPHGCFIGSAAVMVLSDKDNLKQAVQNVIEFFAHESCGQCTPCRVGTEKLSKMMQNNLWNTNTMDRICNVMTDASICGLGQAAANPLVSLWKYFPEKSVSK